MAAVPGNEAAWDRAEGGPHLRFWKGWMPEEEARASFEALDAEGAFPWNVKPRLYGQELNQHAFYHQRKKDGSAKEHGDMPGMVHLQGLCGRVEEELGCEVYGTYCNRFADPGHAIPWHQDKFGTHIAVLSLGSSRRLEFRDNKTKAVEAYEPVAGDLYFMSLDHNKRHYHRVCASDDPGASPRISLVFFVTPPFGRPEYRLSMMDKIRGAANALLS